MLCRCSLIALLASFFLASTSRAANVLMVLNTSTPLASESARIATLQALGHSITTIASSDSQANFDAAMALVDAVYIPPTANSLDYQVRGATIGVFIEMPSQLNRMGISSTFTTPSTHNTLSGLDLTHPILADFAGNSDIQFTGSSITVTVPSGSLAPGLQEIADWNGDSYALTVIETGGALANSHNGNSTASGRRVALPLDASVDWSDLATEGFTVINNSINWLAEGASNNGQSLLLVTINNSLLIEEAFIKSRIQSWGYAVTTIEDSASQTSYDAALSNAEVVYVPETVDSSGVQSKLREATIGVVVEERFLDQEMGFSSGDGVTTGDGTTITITDNSHPITDGLSLGSLTFATTADQLRRTSGTEAPGAQELAGVSGGYQLFAIETGATLANSYNGSDAAFGRRVGLPIGDEFSWHNLSSDGLLLIERSLSWATTLAGPAGHWKLDDGSGTTALDSSGYGRDGTLVGSPTWESQGRIGGSLRFAEDGDDHVALPYTILNGASDVTFATWFRTSAGVNQRAILSAANSGNDNELYIAVDDGDSVIVFDGENSGSNERWTVGSGITDGEWHHLAVVRDDANNQLTLYLDGVSQGTRSRTLNPLEVASGGLVLGEDQDTIGGGFDLPQSFEGSLDEVYLFREALTPERIAALYGPVGHWRFDETSGTTANDSSVAGYDLTATSTPTWTTDAVRTGAVEITGSELVGPGNIDQAFENTVGLAGWVRLDTTVADMAASTAEIIDMQRSSVNTGFDLSFRRTEQTLRFRVYDGTGHTELTWDASSLEADEWLHFAAAYDGQEMRLYINGELAASATNTDGLDIGDVTMRLGEDIVGYLDDLVLYSRPMTQEEIAEHYGLIGHWKLDEVSGSVAADSSGIGNDGTYEGGAIPGGVGPSQLGVTSAAEFSGATGDRIALPEMDYDFSDGVTMAVWYQVNTLDNGNGPYTDFFSLSNGALVDDIWFGFDNSSGLDLFLSDTADGASFRGLIEGVAPVLGVWRHAVAVIDSTGNATLYHDGVAVRSGYTSLPGRVSRTLNGIGETTFVHTIDGLLHDARIYNRPITPEEVRALFFGDFTPGLRIIRWVEVANP